VANGNWSQAARTALLVAVFAVIGVIALSLLIQALVH